MKKNSLMSYLALGVVFALFNVIAFVVPTDKTATFWVAYAFSVVAFAVQIPLWKIALGKKRYAEKQVPRYFRDSRWNYLSDSPTDSIRSLYDLPDASRMVGGYRMRDHPRHLCSLCSSGTSRCERDQPCRRKNQGKTSFYPIFANRY